MDETERKDQGWSDLRTLEHTKLGRDGTFTNAPNEPRMSPEKALLEFDRLSDIEIDVVYRETRRTTHSAIGKADGARLVSDTGKESVDALSR